MEHFCFCQAQNLVARSDRALRRGNPKLGLRELSPNVVRFPWQALVHSATLKMEREAAEEAAKQEGEGGEDSAGAEKDGEDNAKMEG